MVERPIKKSERQAVTPNSNVAKEIKKKERSIEERLDSTTSQSSQRKDRAKRRGKSNQQESRPVNVNPALVRGPKPTLPKSSAPEETPLETVEDSVTETNQDTTIEEAVTETSQDKTSEQ